MVNFNVNPDFAYNTPSIKTPNDIATWNDFIYGYFSDSYYSSGTSAETNYTKLLDASNAKNIIISKSRFNTETYNWVLDNKNLVDYFRYYFVDNDESKAFSQLNVPRGEALNQLAVWEEPKTWLFSNVVRNIILAIGPIGDPGIEFGGSFPEPTAQTLTFSENFTLLNNPFYSNVSASNLTITSSGGYALLYFYGSYNKITITPSFEHIAMASNIVFGFLNKPSVFGLQSNHRKYHGVKFDMYNNSTEQPDLITNPYPFEAPTIDYSLYEDRFVTFNIYEKQT